MIDNEIRKLKDIDQCTILLLVLLGYSMQHISSL